MKKKNTFKVVLESEKQDALAEVKFHMRKTYHLPIKELPQVIEYLEQFKRSAPTKTNKQ